MLIMPYDTESQSRNVLASPLGEEGHEVAKGWTVVRMIMILDVDVTAEGGIIKLIARRAIPPPSAPQALSLPERKRRNPFTQPAAPAAPPFYNLRRSRHHNPRPERPSNLRTLRTFGTKSRQPSRRRRVLSYNPLSPHCDTIKQKPFFNDFRRDHGSIRSSSCAYRIQLV